MKAYDHVTQACDLLYPRGACLNPLQATSAVDGVLSAAAAAKQEAEAANPATARREDAQARLTAKQAEVQGKEQEQRSVAQQVRLTVVVQVLWCHTRHTYWHTNTITVANNHHVYATWMLCADRRNALPKTATTITRTQLLRSHHSSIPAVLLRTYCCHPCTSCRSWS